MVKTITKYYCDICGKEAPYCSKYKIPDIYEKIYHNAHNPELKKEIGGFYPIERYMSEVRRTYISCYKKCKEGGD